MGDADIALLAGHGVFILGSTVRAVHQRAVAFEQRCRHAWHAEALGGAKALPDDFVARAEQSDGNKFIGFWEAMARLELARDPSLLDGPRP
jgi:ribulose-5-phosphate 4-epimerase/fuculose-1-phosphate aldolase